MKNWEAIIFDLDDTLYPERDFVIGGFRQVAKVVGKKLSVDSDAGFNELTKMFDEGARGDTFNRWLRMHDAETPEFVAECVAVYREHTPVITPYPEVKEVLRNLRTRAKIGLVSDGILEVQKRKLSALGLDDFLDAIVFSDEFGRGAWKPSTVPFEAVLKRLNCSPRGSVYVADNSSKDFFGPRQLEMATIRVKRAEGEYSDIKPESPSYSADVTINNLSQLASTLDSLDFRNLEL